MPEPSLDQWTSIFLLAAFQGVFLSLLLLKLNKGNRAAHRFLALLVLLFSLMLMHFVAYWSRYQMVYPHWIGFSSTFPFLYGPILLCYVYTLKKGKYQFNPWDLLHLLPFLMMLLYMLPFYWLSASAKLEVVRRYSTEYSQIRYYWRVFFDIFQNLHLLVYTVWVGYLIFRTPVADNLSKQQISWLKGIFYAFLGFTLNYNIYYVLLYAGMISPTFDYLISFSMSFLIYWIGYKGFLQSEIFADKSIRKSPKYEKSSLRTKEAKVYLERLLELMESKRPYLDNDLKMRDLAAELGLSGHHLSQIINEQLGQTYSDFINSYRIKEAQRLLKSPEYKHIKVVALAYDVGFNTKASFYNHFRKITGKSPTEFRDEIQSS